MLGFGFNKDKSRAAAERFVQQGKLQNAVAEYEKILKNDASDLTVLNTVGDLYSRLGNTDRAIECFRTVGDKYASEGFVPKAIAMYKKLTKLNPSALECIQKLAELYAAQGLLTDARSQFLHAAEGYIKAGEASAAAKIFSRLLQIDPDNVAIQMKLADLYVHQGRREDAKKLLLGSIESMAERGTGEATDTLIEKVLKLDPQNTRALTLRGQMELAKGNAKGAVAALQSVADIDSRPEALKTLFSALLQIDHLDDAEPVAKKLASVHATPSAILEIGEKLVANHPERALAIYEEFSSTLMKADLPALLEHLRTLTSRLRNSTEALNRIQAIYQLTGDNSQRGEILELIAHASVQSGELARARDIYLELSKIEPENPLHAQSYRQVLAKMGADPTLVQSPITDSERPFTMNDEAGAGQEEHWGSAPKLASPEAAMRFDTGENAPSATADVAEFSTATSKALEAQENEAEATVVEVPTEEIPFQASSVPDAITPASDTASSTSFEVHPTTPEAHPEAHEIDISAEWETVAESDSVEVESEEAEAPGVNELLEEVRFYIANGMWKEASRAIDRVEKSAPDGAALAEEFRHQLAAASGMTAAALADTGTTTEITEDGGTVASFEFGNVPVESEIVVPPPPPISMEPPASASAVAHASVASHETASTNALGDFVLDLEKSLGDEFSLAPEPAKAAKAATASASVAAVAPTPSAPTKAAPKPAVVSATPSVPFEQDAGMLSDILDEFKEELGDKGDEPEDPETHYNLGVAFKEMGLLDEAIGELQKVSQSIDRGAHFAQTLQVYTWLAHCFVEKGVPEGSFRWFEKALKYASDDNTRAAVHYELASAYEAAGRKQDALNHFMEVYSTNIDFRDVGERIRSLKS